MFSIEIAIAVVVLGLVLGWILPRVLLVLLGGAIVTGVIAAAADEYSLKWAAITAIELVLGLALGWKLASWIGPKRKISSKTETTP